MALDERDYMRSPEERDKKDAWHRPKEHRRRHSNADFWAKVERRNSGPGIGSILGGLAIGGFAWYMYLTGLGPVQAWESLVVTVKMALHQDRDHIPPSVPDASSQRLARARCANAEAPKRTMKRFRQNEGFQAGSYYEFINATGSPLFVRVFSGIDGPLTETVLLGPGDRVRELAMSPHARLELQTGSRWCNDSDGWEDAHVTQVEGTLPAIAGTTRVAFGSQGDGGIGISVLLPAMELPRAQTIQKAPEQEGKRVALGIQQERVEVLTELRRAAGRQVEFQRSQSAQQKGEEQRPREYAGPAGVVAAQVASPPAETESEAALRSGVRVQDWRNVPQRDLRMVTSGSMYYVGGQVGEEDVQFQLHLGGTSMIGDALAKRVGASNCREGHWLVLDRYWASCKKLVSSVRIGSVTLENVLFAVVPGDVTPVLGSDLVGSARIFKGRDGDYLAVGR